METLNVGKLLFKKIVNLNGIEVDDSQINQMECYIDLLLEKNNVINLISRKDAEFIWERHIVHSIAPLSLFSLPQGADVLDLGTGGGLPGIPLKIMSPHIKLTLLDSINKKVVAIDEFITKLNLKKTIAVCSRAEILKKNFHKNFDIIFSRAVTNLADLIKWSVPLLNTKSKPHTDNSSSGKPKIPNGSLIVYKGGDIEKEIKQVELHRNYKSLKIFDLNIKGIDPTILHDKKIILINF
jgi:16S rRNA (guanine527-N7)-methyltransferase